MRWVASLISLKNDYVIRQVICGGLSCQFEALIDMISHGTGNFSIQVKPTELINKMSPIWDAQLGDTWADLVNSLDLKESGISQQEVDTLLEMLPGSFVDLM